MKSLAEIKAAVQRDEPITDEEEHRLVHEESDAFNAKVADMEERLALQGHMPQEERPPAEQRDFQQVDGDAYRMTVPALGIELHVDRLRRESHALTGELAVRCRLPGARTVGDGLLSVSDFNLSSQRARQERAKYLAARARANDDDVDWGGLVEEFCQRVIAGERAGSPAVLLKDVPRAGPDDVHLVDGLPLLARHPTVIFGDGGAAKSYLALYAAGKLDHKGLRVALADWELAGEDHRERLERLFGPADLPGVFYLRCDRPFVHEVDRLRRLVRDQRIDYLVCDSVSFACDGPPEAAEVAARYLQAMRQLGSIGSLHVAHTSKADNADRKPFGSSFWFNGARGVWYAKLAEPGLLANRITLGLFCRKANTSGLRPPVGFEITFEEERTTFRRVDVADIPDLAGQLSVRQRMAGLLRHGAMDPEELASELQADPETVKRTARRYRQQFTVLPGGRLGLLERRP